ncbi:hypothetical protein COV19_01450 [Candidatus Woesearchaeota archaeon CG10_big_fil_rev_8_21_14_0_10_44_13]|nr:MAG: hypothetical protein COV19_01450 [Candidatus Woesearchaeota archaeon CG10_big_fil_rev_8_21_14_0_10_44_13]
MKDWKYIFGALLLAAGIILNIADIGGRYFLGYGSVGNSLIFVGALVIGVNILRKTFMKNRKIDERMILTALKASRLTFVITIISAFAVMVIDGIRPIALSYSLFMSYSISFIVLIYFLSYNIMLRYS